MPIGDPIVSQWLVDFSLGIPHRITGFPLGVGQPHPSPIDDIGVHIGTRCYIGFFIGSYIHHRERDLTRAHESWANSVLIHSVVLAPLRPSCTCEAI